MGRRSLTKQKRHISGLLSNQTNKGITDRKLLERIAKARGRLHQLKRATNGWKLSVAQRRMVVKTFVFSVTDYLLFLQPLTAEATCKAAELDASCLNYILQKCMTKPTESWAQRGKDIITPSEAGQTQSPSYTSFSQRNTAQRTRAIRPRRMAHHVHI